MSNMSTKKKWLIGLGVISGLGAIVIMALVGFGIWGVSAYMGNTRKVTDAFFGKDQPLGYQPIIGMSFDKGEMHQLVTMLEPAQKKALVAMDFNLTLDREAVLQKADTETKKKWLLDSLNRSDRSTQASNLELEGTESLPLSHGKLEVMNIRLTDKQGRVMPAAVSTLFYPNRRMVLLSLIDADPNPNKAGAFQALDSEIATVVQESKLTQDLIFKPSLAATR
jgi:hypothetical protein